MKWNLSNNIPDTWYAKVVQLLVSLESETKHPQSPLNVKGLFFLPLKK